MARMIPVTLPLEAERRAEGRMFKAQKIGVRSQKENLFIVSKACYSDFSCPQSLRSLRTGTIFWERVW